MKKIFVPALLLGLVLAVTVNASAASEPWRPYGDAYDMVVCTHCLSAAIAMQQLITAYEHSSTCEQIENYPDYIAMKENFKQNAMTDAYLYDVPEAGVFLDTYLDQLGQAICREKKDATICFEHSLCACTAGYYAYIVKSETGLIDRADCTPCPQGGISKENSYSITDCYLPSGTMGSDDLGDFMYTKDCYYQE